MSSTEENWIYWLSRSVKCKLLYKPCVAEICVRCMGVWVFNIYATVIVSGFGTICVSSIYNIQDNFTSIYMNVYVYIYVYSLHIYYICMHVLYIDICTRI